jgi:hypothetical protein
MTSETPGKITPIGDPPAPGNPSPPVQDPIPSTPPAEEPPTRPPAEDPPRPGDPPAEQLH